MATKNLGRAQYSAHRLAGITTLTAVGQTSNLNDKVDFEQLPFLRYPPMFGFFLIQQDISLPSIRPFKYDEIIAFPASAKSVRIQDADGFHDISITEVILPPLADASMVDDGTDTYCVFGWVGINTHMIAKCDAVVPAVYYKAFGPDSYTACQNYIKNNGGV